MDPKDKPGPAKVDWQAPCKCKWCGATTTHFHYTTFMGACKKKACITQSRREHL